MWLSSDAIPLCHHHFSSDQLSATYPKMWHRGPIPFFRCPPGTNTLWTILAALVEKCLFCTVFKHTGWPAHIQVIHNSSLKHTRITEIDQHANFSLAKERFTPFFHRVNDGDIKIMLGQFADYTILIVTKTWCHLFMPSSFLLMSCAKWSLSSAV